MAFRIPKEEYINRTFRLRKELVDRMETICNEKNIRHGIKGNHL